MKLEARPLVGLTIGDPAGIGPEIVLKSLLDTEVQRMCRPVIIGDLGVMQEIRKCCNLDLELRAVASPASGDYKPGIANVVDLRNVDQSVFAYGTVSASSGRASVDYIYEALRLTRAGVLDAIATAPIHKEAIKAAGVPHIGHTELLAAEAGSAETMTMFVTGNMLIFFLTRHVSLREACTLVTRERVAAMLRRADRFLKRLGYTAPVIAVAGLNPHCGDGGLMGREELDEIRPAIEDVLKEGVQAVGPLPADSVFVQAHRGAWNAVLALYHDQGHIASKSLDFDRTVSVTLGLPFVRTSVDHGTAMDIAGQDKANAASMAEAIRVAARYTRSLGNTILA